MEDINYTDYVHTKRVSKDFRSFELCLKIYELDPTCFSTVPGLT